VRVGDAKNDLPFYDPRRPVQPAPETSPPSRWWLLPAVPFAVVFLVVVGGFFLASAVLHVVARFFLGAASLLFYPSEREILRSRLVVDPSSGSDVQVALLVLFCPRCGAQHFDAPDIGNGWTNPPHKTHLCAACGETWRPFEFPTEGVVGG
jgi:hypothetical protein